MGDRKYIVGADIPPIWYSVVELAMGAQEYSKYREAHDEFCKEDDILTRPAGKLPGALAAANWERGIRVTKPSQGGRRRGSRSRGRESSQHGQDQAPPSD